jgi:hypothetical protein
MEQRFILIGENEANELRKLNQNHKFPSDLNKIMSEATWARFIAQMSDDYSRTIKEEKDILEYLHKILGDINYPNKWRKR